MAQTTTSTVSYDTTAYNKQSWFSLRPELLHEANIVNVKSTPQTHRGAAVQFNIVADLTANTTALTETSDITPKNLSDTTVTVTLLERGDAVETTAKVYNTSFIEFDPIVANAVGYHAGISLDTVVRDVALTGTNVRYGGQVAGRPTLTAATVLDSAGLDNLAADMQGANVQTFGGFYRIIIHPDQEYDLRRETGVSGWREFANRQRPMAVERGLVGYFASFEVLRSPRTSILVNGGGATSVVDVYQAIACGQDALAKGFSTGTHGDGQTLGPDPLTVPGPYTDYLYRFRKMGWYHMVGYSVFRQESLRRLETSASRANNVS